MRSSAGIVAFALAVSVAACGQGNGQALHSSTDRSTSSAPAPLVSFDQIPGQFPGGEPNSSGASAAPVGGCVSLIGPRVNPTLAVVECGSADNGYRVVQRVATPDQCVSDVDQKFYLNPDEGQWTACLDYMWSSADCLSIGETTAVRVSCDDPQAHSREKATQVLVGSVSAADCPSGGFAHPARRFTICTETQS